LKIFTVFLLLIRKTWHIVECAFTKFDVICLFMIYIVLYLKERGFHFNKIPSKATSIKINSASDYTLCFVVRHGWAS